LFLQVLENQNFTKIQNKKMASSLFHFSSSLRASHLQLRSDARCDVFPSRNFFRGLYRTFNWLFRFPSTFFVNSINVSLRIISSFRKNEFQRGKLLRIEDLWTLKFGHLSINKKLENKLRRESLRKTSFSDGLCVVV